MARTHALPFRIGGQRNGSSPRNGRTSRNGHARAKPKPPVDDAALTALAVRYQTEDEACVKDAERSAKHALAAGKILLEEVKPKCPKDQWVRWLKANVDCLRRAYDQMALAKDIAKNFGPDLPPVANLLERWRKLLGKHHWTTTKRVTATDSTVSGTSPIVTCAGNSLPTPSTDGSANGSSAAPSGPATNGTTAGGGSSGTSAAPSTNGTHKSPDQEDDEADDSLEGQRKAINKLVESRARAIDSFVTDCLDELDKAGDVWVREGIEPARTALRALLSDIRLGKSHALCPRCEGDGKDAKNPSSGRCTPCRGSGRVPHRVYQQLT